MKLLILAVLALNPLEAMPGYVHTGPPAALGGVASTEILVRKCWPKEEGNYPRRIAWWPGDQVRHNSFYWCDDPNCFMGCGWLAWGTPESPDNPIHR